LSLDIARSFFPWPVLKRLVDRLAGLGLNVLHLHLTDDQGWRLEIPGRPELTARSGHTAIRGGEAGYLTVAEWTGLVEYAAARGVTVVPEIDLPGHVNAALSACPELNQSGVTPEPYDGDDVGISQLTVGPATAAWLRDVLGAVAALTPGPYLHIGGDECPGLSEADFVTLVTLATDIVEAAGKQPVAWQEAAVAGLGDRIIYQFWMSVDYEPAWTVESPDEPAVVTSARRSRAALLREAERGARVIMSPARYTYLDHKTGPDDQRGVDWAGHVSLEKAGSWDPVAILPDLDPTRILGVEAAMWTEYTHTEADLLAMLFPRLDAIAGVAQG
jgi:hexosaminidase